MNDKKEQWLDALPEAFKAYSRGRDIDEVECIIPDLAGMSRGKAMPARKFGPDYITYLPVSIFYQTISGDDVELEIDNQWAEGDLPDSPVPLRAAPVRQGD
jgi:glutamine synthetase